MNTIEIAKMRAQKYGRIVLSHGFNLQEKQSHRQFQVSGTEHPYIVEHTAEGFLCPCKWNSEKRTPCSHIGAVLLFLEHRFPERKSWHAFLTQTPRAEKPLAKPVPVAAPASTWQTACSQSVPVWALR